MYSERLREARQKVGLTQGELARRLGVSQAYLSLVERGMKGPFGPSRSGVLAKALGYTAEEWAGWAADSRAVIGFALGPDGAGEFGRPVLKLLWARYRDMTLDDWDRLYRAIENLPF